MSNFLFAAQLGSFHTPPICKYLANAFSSTFGSPAREGRVNRLFGISGKALYPSGVNALRKKRERVVEKMGIVKERGVKRLKIGRNG